MTVNPFEYDQASLIPKKDVAHYYIDDYNHGRLIRSRRNVFLVGERGSGKTMALLVHRVEYTLLEEYPASVLSEHFLALSIMYHVSETLGLVSSRP